MMNNKQMDFYVFGIIKAIIFFIQPYEYKNLYARSYTPTRPCMHMDVNCNQKIIENKRKLIFKKKNKIQSGFYSAVS